MVRSRPPDDPAWFAAVMGTGATAAAAGLNPAGTQQLAGVSRALALGLFTAASVVFLVLVVRLVLTRHPEWALVRSPLRGPAFATIPGALLVLASASIPIFPGLTGSLIGWALLVAATAIGIALAVGFTVVFFVATFERESVDPQEITGIWFIPETAVLLGALVLAELAAAGPDSWERSLTVAALALLGMGGILFAFTGAVFVNRLITHAQRRTAGVPSIWIMISPLAVTALAMYYVSSEGRYLGGAWGPAVQQTADFMAAMLWGFAVWWIAVAGLITWHGRAMALTYTPADWGFVFPPAAMTITTIALGRYWESGLMETMGVLFTVLLTIVWVLVAGAALRQLDRDRRAKGSPS